jgi:hypothetical protein
MKQPLPPGADPVDTLSAEQVGDILDSSPPPMPPWHGDERRNNLAGRAGAFLLRDIPPAEALTLLLVMNEARCRPPLPAEDVVQLVQNLAHVNSRAPTDTREALPAPSCLLTAEPPAAPEELAVGFLPAAEPVLLAGESGTFKTLLTLMILGAIAGGYPVLGAFAVARPWPVLLVSEEDSHGVLLNHLEALIVGMGWDRIRVLEKFYLLALEGARLDDLRWQAHLEAQIAALSIRVCAWDPLADLLTGDEDNNSAARAVVQFWRRLTALGVTSIAVHHLGKPKEGRGKLHQIRGASTWVNAARAVYVLEQRDGSLWLACEKLSRAERPAVRELTVSIEATPGHPTVWASARLELAHPPGDWKVADRRQLSPAERKALTALDRHREEPLSWSKWLSVSGVASTTLSEVIHRLTGLGYITRKQSGMHAGRPVFVHTITGEGLSALLNFGNSGSTPPSTPPEVSPRNAATPLPLKGAESWGGGEMDPGDGLNAAEGAGVDWPQELEPVDENYLANLLADSRDGLTEPAEDEGVEE